MERLEVALLENITIVVRGLGLFGRFSRFASVSKVELEGSRLTRGVGDEDGSRNLLSASDNLRIMKAAF